jgi:cell division protein FtsB
MDQQLNRRQFAEGQAENLEDHTRHDDSSSVAERLRRLGTEGLRASPQVEMRPHQGFATPIDEGRDQEFALAEDRHNLLIPENLAETLASNTRQGDDHVKIDALQVSFFVQMRDFLHRNSTWLLVAALLLLVLQDLFGTHGVLAMRRSQKEAAAVKREIQQLNDENQKLQNRVQSLKSDPAAIERIAREEMGLARPGEYIFKLEPKPGEPSTPLAHPAEAPKKH